MWQGETIPMLDWLAADHKMVKLYKPESPTDWSGLLWHGNRTEIPSDTPTCGWKGQLCRQNNLQSTVIVVVSILLIVPIAMISACVGVMHIRKVKYESRLKAISSDIIKWEDIYQFQMSRSNRMNSSTSSLQSHKSGVSVKHIFTEVGMYHGNLISIKRLSHDIIDMTVREILVDIKDMTDVKHENLNPFMGICTELPNVSILMAYAHKGSLQDVLADDNVSLNRYFKISLVSDIASGMRFLHGSVIGYHGRLTSAKCLVDNKWTCKITDHGLTYLRKDRNAYLSDKTKQTDYKKYLWTAPELLRPKSAIKANMKTGDVYSFGIIMWEVIFRSQPYCLNKPSLEAEEIIEKVMIGIEPPYRPSISDKTMSCSDLWRNIVYQCWNENVKKRPTFDKIRRMLATLNGGQLPSLIDNMLNHLEIHTHQLEDTVRERTNDLETEKQKTEILLSELLPPSVVTQLKSGKHVNPEAFENVTIFFSDIVGFTEISALAESPMQIIELLNHMYTLFDEISLNYDVYKVATIGDAYVVASGVPIQNGIKHASEICHMAISLLDSVNFYIPNISQKRVQMRIGINSGPCVAGVAGIKMPRYLLFGDTVDIAAMLEAGGQPMKIHIGINTKQLLFDNLSFVIEERGPFNIKGKGSITSYWLMKGL